MSRDFKIKKGLDIRLVGHAEQVTANAPRSRTFAIRPKDFHLTTPKMLVKEGQRLQAGEAVFYAKERPEIQFVSPVSGVLSQIERGAKRVITRIVIEADPQDEYKDYGKIDVKSADSETIKKRLLEGGCWPFIKQRPYDVIANPENQPRDIFVSGFSTAPLAADLDYTLADKKDSLQAALTALSKLTDGSVYVSVAKDGSSVFEGMSDVQLNRFAGPHPAGNVGTQIAKIAPINKGEVVWTVAAADLAIMGELLLTGKYNAERTVALAGSCVKAPKYYKTKQGAEVSTFVYDSGLNNEHARVISGDVLTGTQIKHDGHLGFYDNAISIIPEGDDYEFFGWNKPVFNKISASRAFTFSWMFPKKEYDLDTNTNGEHRAFVVTGSYEEVFPLDIYPMQILKACMVKDLDAMEAMGMYEVSPEDFALTEFICVSKQPHQQIIREGLDLMYKEIG